MRSALAIEDCITEYFAERSRSGRKKRRIQSMNTYSVPTSASPVACQMMIAIVMPEASSTTAKSAAS